MSTRKNHTKKEVREEVQKETQEEVKAPETLPENDSQKEAPEQGLPVEVQGSPESSAKVKRLALERIIVLLDRETRSTVASFTGASRSSVVRAVLMANIDRLSALDRTLTEEQIIEALR